MPYYFTGNHCYDDIIDLPHHQSSSRKKMSMHDRAAQFSPFAALTGYGSAIDETARLTDEKKELYDDKKECINNALRTLIENSDERPGVSVTYFIPDEIKSGGEYINIKGNFRRYDFYENIVIMCDGTRIPVDDISEIEIKL